VEIYTEYIPILLYSFLHTELRVLKIFKIKILIAGDKGAPQNGSFIGVMIRWVDQKARIYGALEKKL